MRRPAALLCGLLVAWVMVGWGGVASAQGDDFFKSSPGPLSTSHAAFDNEDRCNDCHTGGRELSNDKCLACHDHDDLKKRIDAGKGFHASPLVRGKNCQSCHPEHKGRGYDVRGWLSVKGGEKLFNHELTGWKLEGKHAAIDCDECHKTRNKQGLRTFLGVNRECGPCHKEDNPHGFERREMVACERCHTQSTWKPPKAILDFDHNDKGDAAMPLVGAHEDVSCAKCHPKALFKLKNADPDFCGNCHPNAHEKHLFGKKDCAWCHSPAMRSLEKYRFDHDSRTKFELGEAHGPSRMNCYDCHTKSLGERVPDGTCQFCHAKDNQHGDRFNAFGNPPACGVCHPSTKKWSGDAFNHGKRTSFNLVGRHDQINCRACHRGKNAADFERFDPKTIGCMGCHQHKNVHNKQYKDGKCLTCHMKPGMIEQTAKSIDVYHGRNARFPLVKGHKDVKCGKCHVDATFKNTPMECGVRCHQDSLHRGTLGKECLRCHSPGQWEAIRFDHTEDTEFPLLGFHRSMNDCADCHPKRAYDGTPKECSAGPCHAKDDVHRGRLGKKCDQCHRETGDNIFNHNQMARFPLEGQHLTVRCSDCHPSITFKPRPTNCFGCHPEPEVHRGQYGTTCEQCHSTQSFGDIKPLHDVGDFQLKGGHDNLACARCHRDNRPLAGSGNFCINCHRQDDVHGNSLSPRCGECHTQWSFAPARFDHSTVGCNLTGLHRTQACYDCHKTGNFGGLAPQCVSCHRDLALAQAGDPYHARTDCANCHNPNNWLAPVPSPLGGTGYGRDSVCR